VEGVRAHARRLPEQGLREAQAPARRLPELRPVRRPPGRHPGLIAQVPPTAPAPSTGRDDQEWTDQVADPAARLSEVLGVEVDAGLLTLALTHRSYAYEQGGLPTNERLEFLGDSVLGVAVTERLYREHPDLPEGQLAKLRASVVNMHALAGVARALGLGELMYLGRGEEMTGGRDKDSILGDAVEAILGAVHLQHGIDVSRALVLRLFGDLMQAAPRLGAGLDWKTSLQELTAATGQGVPEYRITDEGPDHAKEFTATAVVAGRDLGLGVGRTKKDAEQKAAQAAYEALSGEGADDPADGNGD
jgi:ribonuclease III